MTNPNLTEIIVISDRSGSMGSIADDAIGGFNTFLKEQQEVPGECKFTYCQFDNEYEVVHDGIPIRDMKPLDRSTFVPRGSTALLDAIGRTINVVGERLAKTSEDQRPGKVIVVILTDGQENFSKEFSRDQIFEMITTQHDQFKWEFVFLAANQDAIAGGASLGISAAGSANYSPDAFGSRAIYKNASMGITSFRSGVSHCVNVSDAVSDGAKSRSKS
jgi:uncharacterized protein YegL